MIIITHSLTSLHLSSRQLLSETPSCFVYHSYHTPWSHLIIFYRLKWALEAKSIMEEITVSDGIPDSMHCLHEEEKIAHWQRDDERQGMHPCSGHTVEIDGNVSSRRPGPKGYPHGLGYLWWVNSLWAKAPSDWSTLIYISKLGIILVRKINSQRQKKSQRRKRVFFSNRVSCNKNSRPVIVL